MNVAEKYKGLNRVLNQALQNRFDNIKGLDAW